jgi:hypothetical protein
MNLGADDYLTKPVAKPDLLAAIRSRLERALQQAIRNVILRVCMLRKGIAGGAESSESSASENTAEPTTSVQTAQRYEHYELATGDDGKPVELGRGAMGVTYKAFDINPTTAASAARYGLASSIQRKSPLVSCLHRELESCFHKRRRLRKSLWISTWSSRKFSR